MVNPLLYTQEIRVVLWEKNPDTSLNQNTLAFLDPKLTRHRNYSCTRLCVLFFSAYGTLPNKRSVFICFEKILLKRPVHFDAGAQFGYLKCEKEELGHRNVEHEAFSQDTQRVFSFTGLSSGPFEVSDSRSLAFKRWRAAETVTQCLRVNDNFDSSTFCELTFKRWILIDLVFFFLKSLHACDWNRSFAPGFPGPNASHCKPLRRNTAVWSRHQEDSAE